MAGYTDFKNVESGENGSIEGRLPLDTAASAFRYKKELLFFVPFSTFIATFIRKITGKWHIRIRANESPEAPILFEQEVTWEAVVTAIGDPFFGFFSGNISMATWQPGADNPANIKTTIIDGVPVNPEDAWKHLDFKNATPLSHFGTTVFEPVATVTFGGVWLDASWLSQPYKMNLPAGAVLEIVMDGWQVGTLRNEATYQFSFKEAAPVLDTYWDVAGGFHVALPVGDRTEIHHQYIEAGLELTEARAVLKEVSQPSIFKDAEDRLWLAGQVADKYKLFLSRNNGLTFRPETLPVTTDGVTVESEVVIWDGGYTYPFSGCLRDDSIASIATQAGKLWFKSSRDAFAYSALVGTANPATPYHFGELPGTGLVATNGYADYFVSRDGGLSWNKLEREIWSSGYQRPFTLMASNGTAYSIAANAGRLWLKTSRDNFSYSSVIGSVSGSRAYRIAERFKGASLVVTDGLNDVFISRSGGEGWVKQDAAT